MVLKMAVSLQWLKWLGCMWLVQVQELTEVLEQKLALVAQLEQEQQQLLTRCQALQSLVGAQPEGEVGGTAGHGQGVGGDKWEQQLSQAGETARCVSHCCLQCASDI